MGIVIQHVRLSEKQIKKEVRMKKENVVSFKLSDSDYVQLMELRKRFPIGWFSKKMRGFIRVLLHEENKNVSSIQ